MRNEGEGGKVKEGEGKRETYLLEGGFDRQFQLLVPCRTWGKK